MQGSMNMEGMIPKNIFTVWICIVSFMGSIGPPFEFRNQDFLYLMNL